MLAAAQPNLPDPQADIVAQPIGVTILDLDRTLTKRGTYSPFLLQAAWADAPWRLTLVPAVLAGMAAYPLGLISRKSLKQAMQRLMLGRQVRRAQAEALAARFADRLLARGLHAEALPLIARERAAGRTLILATAAHRFYVTAIAARLGIDHVVATESEWHGDTLLPGIAGDNCYGPAKRDAVLACLGRLAIARPAAHLRCYSDDRSDLPIFEASDERLVVNPKRKLARLADERGWRRLRFR
jgi:HAD superfamily hydrolase (TIGR01490 family)